MLRQQVQETQHTTSPRMRGTEAGTALSGPDAAQVLETASLLQSAVQDKLSVAEIEALAARRGIAAGHVRQALQLHGHQQATSASLPRVHLSPRQRLVALALPPLYAILAIVLFLRFLGGSTLIQSAAFQILYSTAPISLSFVVGYGLRYKRVGAAVGGAITLAAFGVLFLAVQAISGGYTYSKDDIRVFLLLILVTTLTGGIGAIARQWFTSRQLPHQPTLLKASDQDR